MTAAFCVCCSSINCSPMYGESALGQGDDSCLLCLPFKYLLQLLFFSCGSIDEKSFEFIGNFGDVFDQNESESFAILFVVLVGLEVAAQHPARVAGEGS